MQISVVVVDPRPLVRDALSRLLRDDQELQVEEPASGLEEFLGRTPELPVCVAVVGSQAWQQLDQQVLLEKTRYGKGIKVLILADEYQEETICRMLMLGCSGYLAADVSVDVLKKAIHAVARGEIWAERHLMARTLQQALTASGSETILTARERDVLGLLRAGCTNRQIAAHLFLSPETVKWHMRKVFGKIGAKDRLEAALYARENNIFPRPEKGDRGLAPALPPKTSA